MKVRSQQNQPRPRAGQTEPPPEDDGLWHDLKNDLREWLLHVDQEKIHDLGQLVKSAGGGMKGAWKQVRDIPRRLLDLPIVKDKVDEDDRRRWAELGETVGKGIGFAAAGGHGLAGGLKFLSGQRQGDTSKKLDGLVDVATASVIAASVAGWGLAREVAAPVAAVLNVVRGGFNAGAGFRRHDARFQLQGVLDASRSLGSFGRLLKGHHALLNGVGIALAPIAGAVQVGRGMHDLSIGLRNDDNKTQLKGLVDMATAVGTAMAFASGAAVIPGVALAVAANLVKVGYQVSPRFRGWMDGRLDKAEPKLQKMVDTTEKLTRPLVDGWHALMKKLVKKVDAERPEQFSKAQLAEILNLLQADQDFSKAEEKRLRSVLESAGQKDQMPSNEDPPPPLRRSELMTELQTHDQRIDFVRFLLVVADYDWQVRQEENLFLDQIAATLGLTPEELEELRRERESLKQQLLALSPESLGNPPGDQLDTLGWLPHRDQHPPRL